MTDIDPTLPPVDVEPVSEDPFVWSKDNVIQSTWSHYVIIGASVFSIAWGAVNALRVSSRILYLFLECLI